MKEQVLKIIADYKGVSPESIDEKASFSELGFDSLDVTELMVRLEDELNREIELSPQITNVESLLEYLGA